MNRRDLLKGILVAGCFPAIVRAESLMKIWVPPEKKIITGDDVAWDPAGSADTGYIAVFFDGKMYLVKRYIKLIGAHIYHSDTANGNFEKVK